MAIPVSVRLILQQCREWATHPVVFPAKTRHEENAGEDRQSVDKMGETRVLYVLPRVLFMSLCMDVHTFFMHGMRQNMDLAEAACFEYQAKQSGPLEFSRRPTPQTIYCACAGFA